MLDKNYAETVTFVLFISVICDVLDKDLLSSEATFDMFQRMGWR